VSSSLNASMKYCPKNMYEGTGRFHNAFLSIQNNEKLLPAEMRASPAYEFACYKEILPSVRILAVVQKQRI